MESGLLSNIAFRSGNDGADLFRHTCRSCHTIDGYNGLKRAFEGTDRAFIASIVKATHLVKGNMPPFPGTPVEADLIAGYISGQLDHRSLSEITGLQGVALGKKVFELRCEKCHIPGTTMDKVKSLEGMSEQDLGSVLDMAADLGEGMPAFTAGAADRAALISYLKTLPSGGEK
jgi:mono/diheme cytochrome c family protein